MPRRPASRVFPLVVIAALGGGCSTPGKAPEVATTKYSIDVADLERRLKRVDSTYDVIIRRLRNDSGTTRADSQFLSLERELADTVRHVMDSANNDALQLHLWPDGAVGQHVRRTGNYVIAPTSIDGRPTEVALQELLARNGVRVHRAEGDSYFWVDQARLLAAASPFITDAMRDFMRVIVQEQQEPFTEHEVLTVHIDTLAHRLQHIDALIMRHASSMVAPKLVALRTTMLDGYLAGFANTPVFDTSGVLLPEVRQSYERFVVNAPGSYSGAVVLRYLDLLRASGFRRSSAIDDFNTVRLRASH